MLCNGKKRLNQDERLVLKVYQYENYKSYFYVNPFTQETRWFQDIVTDMANHCSLEQIDLVCAHNSPSNHVLPTFCTRLIQKYITINTDDQPVHSCGVSDQSLIQLSFCVPLELVNLSLHKAIIPKSQYVIDTHNNMLFVQFGDNFCNDAHLVLPIGNYSVQEIAVSIQSLGQTLVHSSFTCTLDLQMYTLRFECNIQFRFNILPYDKLPICFDPVGMRPNDTENPYTVSSVCGTHQNFYYQSRLDDDTGKQLMVTSHVDVSGCQLLLIRSPTLHDRLVACVPLNDINPPAGIVFYHNENRPLRPEYGWNYSMTRMKRSFKQIECCVTDSRGRRYNFHDVRRVYVFELTFVEYYNA